MNAVATLPYAGANRRALHAASRRQVDKKFAEHRLQDENARMQAQLAAVKVHFDALNNHARKHYPGDGFGDLLLDLHQQIDLFPAVGWDADAKADIARLTAERDAAVEALRSYSAACNWEAVDDGSICRAWLEPDSNTPHAYNGWELARAALASIKQEAAS